MLFLDNILKTILDKTSFIYRYFIENKILILKLTITIIIIASCTYIFFNVNKKINNTIKELFNVATEIRFYYADKSDYWKLSTDTIIKNKIINNHFINYNENSINISNNQKIQVGFGKDADIIMPTSQTFDIIMNNLNKSKCISYSQAEINEDMLLELVQISIINDEGSHIFGWGENNTLPIKKYTTKNLCTNKNNTVIWTFK